ncbi:hypothetical protein HHK36_025858 [Tetracentron sinense]|uniref:Uncharacterized protein n=1 Tax=Tetracentron sinense TaxID=13715 RepID=A0A834YJJ1_TETSI|nr:hypothetical protein HHK36_025858 [Tetracentron sinense]
MPLDQTVMDPLTRRQEHEWVLDIRRNIEEGPDNPDEGITVSIFNVPKTLISIKQEAYIPQQVALGPYHHWRPELYEMDRYKLSSARRTQKQFRNMKLPNLMEHFVEHEANIRACYHSYLDFGGETLAWMFAVDASFLLEYLQNYVVKNDASLARVSSKKTHLVDYTRRKIGHHVILRDIIMLENQIPLFLLRDLHGFCELEKPNKVLAVMLLGFCKDLCPIKMLDYSHIKEEECLRAAHLLELLYYMVVPELQVTVEIEELEKANELENDGCCKKAFNSVSSVLCFLNLAPIRCLGIICKSENFRLVIKLPWKIIKNILRAATKKRIEILVSSVRNVAEQVETVLSQKEEESPLIEELAIPSVTELSNSGVKFRPSKGGLGTIDFNKASATFYLPILKDIISWRTKSLFFLLREIHEFYETEEPNEVLEMMLMGFCKDRCPIKMLDYSHFREEECLRAAHLLELLYYMVAPELQVSPEIKVLKKPNEVENAESLVSSAENLAKEVETVDSKKEDESPLIEEVMIPSVTKLSKSGIKFRPAKGGLWTIEFNKASASFYLPILNLNKNSVVLRNLIAYKASIAYEASIAPEVMIYICTLRRIDERNNW